MSDQPIVLTPLSLLGAIGDLPPEKRQALFRMVRSAGLDIEANYVLVPAEIYNDLVAIAKFAPKAMKEAHRQAKQHEAYREQVAPYKKGPKGKANRKQDRHKQIDKLNGQGFRTDDGGKEIFKHLHDNYPKLVKTSKGERFISAKSMWEMYQKSKRGPRLLQ
jgi:hypothetical protein